MLSHLRYPFGTAYETLLLLPLIGSIAFISVLPGEMRRLGDDGYPPFDAAIGLPVPFGLAITVYVVIRRRIYDRAADRIEYLYERCGDQEAENLAKLYAFPLIAMALVFPFGMAVLLLWNGVVFLDELQIIEWSLLLVLVVFGLVGLVLVKGRNHRAMIYIGWYLHSDFPQNDTPRLRPRALGRTQSDVDDYELAVKEFTTPWRGESGKPAKKAPRKSLSHSASD
ncbi:hypothetical protein I2485_02070 [Nesterenkonia sp. E16_7]|uniref:hypothetical protein n=1 Tax=unclassified Nesterenkonia TaxID=2629769 RepID=UPI001A911F10|nr:MULTISPECIES: hypothetical protein [unclassified Nesterenkonia]MBO0594685.1 hypothetical protein [Nesterenkonia sp. E16_10]MBO0597434.1 hypothetical protein [Nesterenkonia sp. E16_7]